MKTVKELPCVLTDAEIVDKNQEMVARMARINTLELEAKQARDSFKGKIAEEEERISSIAKLCRDREEFRPVECTQVPLEGKGQVVTVRLDTGEEIGRRPLTDAERNGNLFEGEDQPQDEEEVHAALIVNLCEVLRIVGVDLTPRRLWHLDNKQIGKAHSWAEKAKDQPEDERKMPTLIAEIVERVEKERVAENERVELIRRANQLLREAGEEVDPLVIGNLTVDQLNEVSDYAQRRVEAKQAPADQPLPELARPSCLAPLDGEEIIEDDDEQTNEQANDGAEDNAE